jgi:hypothetical protein
VRHGGHLGGIQQRRGFTPGGTGPLGGRQFQDADAAVGAGDGEAPAPAFTRRELDIGGEASSASPAACLPFSITVVAVASRAVPSEYRLRAPPVPPPVGISSESPCRMRIFSIGMPSWWLVIMA